MLLTESKKLRIKTTKRKKINSNTSGSTQFDLIVLWQKKKGNIPDFFDNILSLVIVAKKKRKNLKVTEPTEISTKS